MYDKVHNDIRRQTGEVLEFLSQRDKFWEQLNS